MRSGAQAHRGLSSPLLIPLFATGFEAGLRSELDMACRHESLAFPESRLFKPFLRAKNSDYREPGQEAPADAQGSAKSERERFHGYQRAQEIRDSLMSDRHSEAAKRIRKELRRLRLPRRRCQAHVSGGRRWRTEVRRAGETRIRFGAQASPALQRAGRLMHGGDG
jgi:hypothetical protein